jgi:hypothetical protein
MVSSDVNVVLESLEKEHPGAGGVAKPISREKLAKIIEGTLWTRLLKRMRSLRKS